MSPSFETDMYSLEISTFEIMAGVPTPCSDVLPVSKTARKTFFFFQDVLKRWSFQKNWLEYDLSRIIQKVHVSFSRKYDLRPETENERWSFSKKTHENMIFSSNFLKRWSFQKGPRRGMIFLVLSGKMIFFPENTIFFPWAGSQRWPFSRNAWKYDIFCVPLWVLQTWFHVPLPKKINDGLIPQNTPKVIDVLDWHPWKSSSNSLYFHGDLYGCFHVFYMYEKKQET